MGGLFLIVCGLAVLGAATCACMIIDACHGFAEWRRVRRKLREMPRG